MLGTLWMRGPRKHCLGALNQDQPASGVSLIAYWLANDFQATVKGQEICEGSWVGPSSPAFHGAIGRQQCRIAQSTSSEGVFASVHQVEIAPSI